MVLKIMWRKKHMTYGSMAPTCLPDEAMVLLRLTIYRFHSLAYFHFSCFWQNICLIKLNVDISGHYRNCLYSIERSKYFWHRPDCFRTIRTVWKPSGQFENHPDSLKTVLTVWKPSGKFETRPDKTVWTKLKPSGLFYISPDGIGSVQTVLNPSGQFPHCMYSF